MKFAQTDETSKQPLRISKKKYTPTKMVTKVFWLTLVIFIIINIYSENRVSEKH